MSHKASNFRTTLKTARGLGSAGEGTGHFWLQRTTALALIPLCVWFIYKLATVLIAADRAGVIRAFKDPLTAILTAILVAALFIHARLGIQTIIEDYVHCECAKITLLILNSAIKLFLCLASIMAIAHLHFVGA